MVDGRWLTFDGCLLIPDAGCLMLIARCLTAHDSRFMVHASCLMAPGIWLMAKKEAVLVRCARPRAPFLAMSDEAWSIGCEPMAMSHEPFVN